MPSLAELNGLVMWKTIDLYCMGVYIQQGKHKKVFVTDFTSNPKITGEYTKETSFGDIEDLKESDMLLQVNLFSETWTSFCNTYKGFHKEDLCDDALLNEYNNHDILPKLYFMKAAVRFQTYKGMFEGKLINVHLLEQDESDDALQLYERFFKHASRLFIQQNNVTLKALVPQKFCKYIEDALRMSIEQPQQPDSIVKQEVDDMSTQIKQEHSAADLSLSRNQAFANDLTSSPPPQENDENIPLPLQLQRSRPDLQVSDSEGTCLPAQHAPVDLPLFEDFMFCIAEPASTDGHLKGSFGCQDDYFSISDLNKKMYDPMDQLELASYKIRGFIVGTIPDDLSYTCVKSYEFDHELKKYKPGDPFLRELEILICDDETPSADGEMIQLSESNSLKITLEGPEILKFFDDVEHNYVETFYTKTQQYNQTMGRYLRKNKRRFIDIEVRQKPLEADNVSVPVWTSDSLTLSNLLRT